MFGEEKYISEFICYLKFHFRTPVILNRGIVWRTIIRQTILGVYFHGRYIFDYYTGYS